MSPVLLIVLAGLWAAVLIPATVRSRDHAHDGRTMEGFHTAMRTLSRRSPSATDSRRILVPTSQMTGAGSPRADVGRRRTVLLRLLLAAAVTLLLGVARGGVFWALHLLALAGVAATVVWLRRTAVAEAELARRERAALRVERDRREAAELAAYRSRAARATYAEVPHRRAVND